MIAVATETVAESVESAEGSIGAVSESADTVAAAIDAAPTFDECRGTIRDFICREPAKREVYLEALRFVADRKVAPRFDVEDRMMTCAAAHAVHFAPSTMIEGLVSVGALVERLPEPEHDKDTGEDFIDSAKITYQITDEGKAAQEDLSPRRRLDALFAADPSHVGGFLKLLSLCSSGARGRDEINTLLEQECAAEPLRDHGLPGLYPSYFTDALERAGGLTWNRGWTATSEGVDFLNQMKAES